LAGQGMKLLNEVWQSALKDQNGDKRRLDESQSKFFTKKEFGLYLKINLENFSSKHFGESLRDSPYPS
jgi:hypothetical protein